MNDLTFTSIETLHAFDMEGNFLFTLDELQDVSINQTEEKQEITGKMGRKLSSLKKNKAVTISGTNGLVSAGLLELQTGSKFENKETTILFTEYLKVDKNSAATNYVAVGTEGAEIIDLYINTADNIAGAKYTQSDEAAAQKFTYNPATKIIAFADGEVADGTEIIVKYKRKIAADVHKNYSDKYSGKCQLYIDFLCEDKCSKVYRGQFYFEKTDFNGEFSLEFGDNQTVHAFEAESLAGSCGSAGELWTYTVFGVNAEDIPA